MTSESVVDREAILEIVRDAWTDSAAQTAVHAADRLEALVAATIRAQAAGSDFVLVPREPTRAMWAAMGNALVGYRNRHHDKVAEELWKGVLAAAPSTTPPQEA